MKIQVQNVNFNGSTKLSETVEKKLLKLDTLYDKIKCANIYFKIENNNEKNNKTTEIVLEVPGDDLVVKKTGQTFEEGIDLAVDSLKRLLIKKKEKTSH